MKKVSIKIKDNKCWNALATLKTQYSPLAAEWGNLTAEQRRAVLDNSPILRELVTFFAQFGGG